VYPVLLEIGPIQISSFGAMIVAAFLATNYFLKKKFIHYGYNPEYADDIIFRAALGGILGAKIYYLLENVGNGAYENIYGIVDIFYGIVSFNATLISEGIMAFGGGLVFLGGLIGGLILVSHYIIKKSLDWLTMADIIAPLIALGHAIGRIGCLLVGDDYGVPTNLPWGMSFPNGLPPTTFESFRLNYPDVFYSDLFQTTYSAGDVIAVHPTQIYEMVLYFFIYLFLNKMLHKKRFNGEIFMNYLFLAGFARFMVEFIRVNPKYLLDLSGAQIISIGMMILATAFHYYSRVYRKDAKS
tara:strand:+ start:1025 stop:1918 length:894 start_codon:yes stop_codon:yes gene_type:complete